MIEGEGSFIWRKLPACVLFAKQATVLRHYES
jgi:hypothetical protein